MDGVQPTIVVTGVAGNLGLRLLGQLKDFTVIGVDLAAPRNTQLQRFVEMDLGLESSCQALIHLLRETNPVAVVHLAFVIDPVRTGVLDVDRMWQINVAGTARVMEAIAEVNRGREDGIRQFIFPSSVSAYGPDFPEIATEESPLRAHTLPYAIHKKESDEVVRFRAPSLGQCSTVILRPHIFAGASVQNYLMGAFRGTPNGRSARAAKLRERGVRLPCMFPIGRRYLDNKIQFIHVDDMARLIAWLLRRPADTGQATKNGVGQLTVLNVAARGEPMTFRECIEIAQAKVIRVPGKAAMRAVLQLMWRLGISAIPPDAMPYMTGQYIMNTDRLRKMLGSDYERVLTHTSREAFADSFSDS